MLLQREGKRQRPVFCPLVHAPYGHKGQGWDSMKPGARASPGSPCICGSPNILVILCCSPRSIRYKLASIWDTSILCMYHKMVEFYTEMSLYLNRSPETSFLKFSLRKKNQINIIHIHIYFLKSTWENYSLRHSILL